MKEIDLADEPDDTERFSLAQKQQENRLARLARYEAALRSIANGSDIIAAHHVARRALETT